MKPIGKYGMIEGPDGSGKTTIVSMLTSDASFGLPVARVREPGGTLFGEDVRSLFHKHPKLSPAIKFNLMFAARSALKPVIEEYLGEKHVISDRGFPSTFAYQIKGEDAGHLEHSFWELLFSDCILIPDFIILLDVGIKNADERMSNARSDIGIKEFDDAEWSFKQRVHDGYREFENKWQHRLWSTPAQRQMQHMSGLVKPNIIPVYSVDANQPYGLVYQEVHEICKKEFQK